MKSLIVGALLLPLGLVGCGGITAGVTGEAAPCIAALVASGSTNPADLFAVAQRTPECLILAGDALAAALDMAASHK